MLMAAVAWTLVIPTVASVPTDTLSNLQASRPQRRGEPNHEAPVRPQYDQDWTSRTIYVVISMFCLALLTGMLGYRARLLERKHFKNLNLTRILVFILYLLAICFVTSTSVVESGLGLSTLATCHSAIIICLAFYLGSKITMYVFLVERAHAIRAPYMRRRSDFIWLVGIFFIAAGFGSIAICGFIWPISDMSKVDGRCRIGLPLKVTIPLLTFDVIINTALTGIFIYLLRPLLRWTLRPRTILNEPERPRTGKRIRNMLGGSDAPSTSATITDFYRINQTMHKSIEVLLWKTLTGCVLVMLPTVGNLAALYIMEGRELGWLCLTICSCDVTWAVAVIHWLTIGSTDICERDLALLVHQDGASSNTTVEGTPI